MLFVVLFVVLFVLRSVMRFVVRVEFDVVQLSCAEGRRRCVAGVPVDSFCGQVFCGGAGPWISGRGYAAVRLELDRVSRGWIVVCWYRGECNGMMTRLKKKTRPGRRVIFFKAVVVKTLRSFRGGNRGRHRF